jgi:hypothetical protein
MPGPDLQHSRLTAIDRWRSYRSGQSYGGAATAQGSLMVAQLPLRAKWGSLMVETHTGRSDRPEPPPPGSISSSHFVSARLYLLGGTFVTTSEPVYRRR